MLPVCLFWKLHLPKVDGQFYYCSPGSCHFMSFALTLFNLKRKAKKKNQSPCACLFPSLVQFNTCISLTSAVQFSSNCAKPQRLILCKRWGSISWRAASSSFLPQENILGSPGLGGGWYEASPKPLLAGGEEDLDYTWLTPSLLHLSCCLEERWFPLQVGSLAPVRTWKWIFSVLIRFWVPSKSWSIILIAANLPGFEEAS